MPDVVVIGSGHNGLVAAATLASRGRSVVVLERMRDFGGRLAPFAPFPGFNASPCIDHGGQLRPALCESLALARHGLRLYPIDPLVFAPSGSESLTLWRDDSATQAEIARFSTHDARRWVDFRRFLRTAAAFLERVADTAPPSLDTTDVAQLLEAGRLGMRFRLMGRDRMVALIRMLTMSMADFLDEWFETPLLKAAVAAPALTGSFHGPLAPATAGLLAWRAVADAQGLRPEGSGDWISPLLAVCRARGVVLRENAAVVEVLCTGGRASGVRLADGSAIEAGTVIADVDPRYVPDLLAPGAIATRFVEEVEEIKSRGLCARIFLRMRELPRFACEVRDAQLKGRIHFGADLFALERAWDAARRGRCADRPLVEMWIPSLGNPKVAPAGEHLVTLTVTGVPYRLAQGSWGEGKELFADNVIAHLVPEIPNLREAVTQRLVLLPCDLERAYGLPGGHLLHGETGLDQWFVGRPVASAARYETPLPGLYLCGTGTHSGGGAVSGASGALCADEIALKADGAIAAREKNRRIVTGAVGIGLALAGAGLAARGAWLKLSNGSSKAAGEKN